MTFLFLPTAAQRLRVGVPRVVVKEAVKFQAGSDRSIEKQLQSGHEKGALIVPLEQQVTSTGTKCEGEGILSKVSKFAKSAAGLLGKFAAGQTVAAWLLTFGSAVGSLSSLLGDLRNCEVDGEPPMKWSAMQAMIDIHINKALAEKDEQETKELLGSYDDFIAETLHYPLYDPLVEETAGFYSDLNKHIVDAQSQFAYKYTLEMNVAMLGQLVQLGTAKMMQECNHGTRDLSTKERLCKHHANDVQNKIERSVDFFQKKVSPSSDEHWYKTWLGEPEIEVEFVDRHKCFHCWDWCELHLSINSTVVDNMAVADIYSPGYGSRTCSSWREYWGKEITKDSSKTAKKVAILESHVKGPVYKKWTNLVNDREMQWWEKGVGDSVTFEETLNEFRGLDFTSKCCADLSSTMEDGVA